MAKADASNAEWEILIVDDDPEVHDATRLALKRKTWKKRSLSLTSAMTGREARDLLMDREYRGRVRVVVIDVAMETRLAGLDLCRFIRSELSRSIRLILRTGQLGSTPEERLINDYDIDACLTKTEATPERLASAIRAGLRSSQDIETLLAFSDQLRAFTTALQTMPNREDLTRFMRAGLDFLEGKHSARIVFVPDVDALDAASEGEGAEVALVAKAHALELELGKLHNAAMLGGSSSSVVLHFTIAIEESLDPPTRGGFVFEARSTIHGLQSDLLLFLQNWTIAMSGLSLQIRLTRAKALQERMQLDRMQNFANMVMGLAHKINTPLGIAHTANRSLNELAAEIEKIPIPPEMAGVLPDVRATMRLLDRNIGRATQLMSNFLQLSLSRLNDERVTTDILEVARDCVHVIVRPPEITIRLTSQSEAVAWVGYPNHLMQVLTTLIENAVRHAFPGYPSGEIDIRIKDDAHFYRLEVDDNGQGIALETMPHLFEPFAVWSGSSETGLGLAVTHNIVTNLLRGELTCTSTIGGGTRFVVRLPREVPLSAGKGSLTSLPPMRSRPPTMA